MLVKWNPRQLHMSIDTLGNWLRCSVDDHGALVAVCIGWMPGPRDGIGTLFEAQLAMGRRDTVGKPLISSGLPAVPGLL